MREDETPAESQILPETAVHQVKSKFTYPQAKKNILLFLKRRATKQKLQFDLKFVFLLHIGYNSK